MDAINMVTGKMPVLTVQTPDGPVKIRPNRNNECVLSFTNGISLIISVENTGIDGQAEDVMYTGRYIDEHGKSVPGGHVYGSLEHLRKGVSVLVDARTRNGIHVMNT